MDSDSTHSFVNPSVLREKWMKITQITFLIVIVANGDRMITEL
jgi:hypothetical protein